jgi:hypothetical protein
MPAPAIAVFNLPPPFELFASREPESPRIHHHIKLPARFGPEF